jgi:uncharacterized membrane protein
MCGGKQKLNKAVDKSNAMSDKVFEWSLSALSIIAILWMLLGSLFGILGVAWVIIIGLVLWIAGGGVLLYFWGKNYMSRV